MKLLFATRILRMIGFGIISVLMVLYLAKLGFSPWLIGVLLTMTLVGDTLISLWITINADRIGRRKMLIAGSVLMIFAGIVFALSDNFLMLLFAATIGVISPSGNEVGPFLAIEQAALSTLTTNKNRTKIFAWYNLVGSFATAVGALMGGIILTMLQKSGMDSLTSNKIVIGLYSGVGVAMAALFARLPASVETEPSANSLKSKLGLHKSKTVVFILSALFSLDAFAGGFVMQSLLAYWLHIRFGANEAVLGGIFFGANLLAGFSALSAASIAKRIGLIRTMVFTHIPSNLLLILVSFMPNLQLAIIVLLLRFSISQMDVPTRQAYTMAVVEPDERSAAAGITGIARTTGSSVSPSISSAIMANQTLLAVPLIIAGSLKIVYDLLLFRAFKNSENIQ